MLQATCVPVFSGGKSSDHRTVRVGSPYAWSGWAASTGLALHQRPCMVVPSECIFSDIAPPFEPERWVVWRASARN